MTDEQRQFEYDLTVSVQYYDTDTRKNEMTNLKENTVVKYEVNKDSVNYNYNLHLLTITNITQLMYTILNLESSRIIIQLSENGTEIFKNTFVIENVSVVDEIESVRNIQLLLTTEEVRKFRKSNKYSKQSLMDTNSADTLIISYELLSKTLQAISSDYGSDLDAHYVDAGAIKQLYESIRIPENLNDFEAFDFIFKEFPPYLLTPYFIFDDFHFGESSTLYNIIVNNICNLAGSYQMKNVKNIIRYNTGTKHYHGNVPLVDYTEIYDELKATLVIKNNNQNKIYELQPAANDYKSDNVKQIETNLDIDVYKSRMYMKKRLADYEATLERYSFDDLNIKDISFMNVYNITSNDYDHLPVAIEYIFTLNQRNTFDLETYINFVKVPANILASS